MGTVGVIEKFASDTRLNATAALKFAYSEQQKRALENIIQLTEYILRGYQARTSPLSSRMTRHPTPPWVSALRDHQVTAIKEITEAFQYTNVVMLDAPTGTGKTLAGQQVAAELDANAIYACSDKQLQDQFIHDFEYAKVIKGRSNYPTEFGDDDKNAEDCTANGPDDGCWYCNGYHACPYQLAKNRALRADMAVLNTSYLLACANYTGDFTGRDLVIVDEADTLEGQLMGFVELRAGAWLIRECGMVAPKKAARKTTLVKWLTEFSVALKQLAKRQSEVKIRKRYAALADECVTVARELTCDIEANADDEDTGKWLRDYDKYDNLILKPVTVNRYGNKYLWRHGKKWLLMSATIISGDEVASSLGISQEWEVVTVPMTFPKDNRPIILAPVANVIYKEMDNATPRLAQATRNILAWHPGERVLVHAVSYKLARSIVAGIQPGSQRPIYTYTESSGRKEALAAYLRTPGAVLVAPSMERGVDLADDACRVQVVCKTPYLALGDRQVSARRWLPGGQLWYDVQAIRDLVQMTGRAVRHEQDHATTYILDEQFTRNLWRNNKYLFPGWWREAVDTRFPVRELLLPC